MLKLIGPNPSLPSDHPLLCYQYNESDRWSSSEIDAFHQALLAHDKDFHRIAREVRTKTVKQCVQFFYMWKKICVEDYRRFKQSRDRRCGFRRGMEADAEEKQYPDAKLLGVSFFVGVGQC